MWPKTSDTIIKDSLMTRQKELYRNENRMTPAIWHKSHKVDIAEVFTELELLQSKKEDKDKSTCTKKEGIPTSLPEALDVIKSTDSCKVLITGKGGMGKTTLLKYIAHQWATDGEHVFADKLLFLINIREIKTKERFLDIILNKINFEEINFKNNLSCNSVKRFLVTHEDEIIILLDGYDELERNAEDPFDLFNRSELRESTVVITSRPDNTADLVECCDVHIEVKGFSPSNIKKYIQNHFHSISKIEIGDTLIKEFRLHSEDTSYWGGSHKEAFELCSSPLLLLQICTIWELKCVLPTYLPDLFKELICCILNQYLNRAGNKSVIANFDRIPDQYISAFLILGECMYEELKKNILSIDKYVLSKIAKDKELLNLALELGFVYEDTPANPGDVKEMYTPPHKLISEALVGLYLSTEIQKGSSNVEYEEIRCNKYLNMTRVFAIGFLGADADKLLKPWLIIRASNYHSILQCLDYIKEEHEDDILKKLDKHMTNDVKTYNKQMFESLSILNNNSVYSVQNLWSISNPLNDNLSVQISEFFKNLPNDDLSCIYLFKFLKMCMKCFMCMNIDKLEGEVVSLINRCRDRRCQIIEHTLLLFEVIQNFKDDNHKPNDILKCISTWDKEEINSLSAEMEKHHLKYYLTEVVINFEISSTFLIHLLKYASEVKVLIFSKLSCWLTGTILNEVINEMYNANRKLELKILDIEDNDLNDIDGMLLGKLFKIAPELEFLNLTNCRLSGGILRTMIAECQNKIKKLDINNCSNSSGSINEIKKECGRMNTFLINCNLRLKGNDLSDIDGKSFAELVRAICQQFHYKTYEYYYCYYYEEEKDTIFRWSDYSLTVDNLEMLVESICENITLTWEKIDLSGINLSSMNGITLAHLFKVSPELRLIDMRDCSLSGSIVNEMMEGCSRMNVVLKDEMLRLEANDLSDIDGKSLAELVRVIKKSSRWSNYSLTADNLKKLVESLGEENITLNWQRINLSKINLSPISGRTLAHLFKASPELEFIDMSDCSLSGNIVNEMMEECCRMNVVLKDGMLWLAGNDLSDIDGKSLAALINLNTIFGEYTKWSDYSLKANSLKMLVDYVGENITLTWEMIDLSGINLSLISGIILAHLFKVSPDLKYIEMRDCSLSGRIVNEMMEECSRMNVVLKDEMLILKGNDLSDIDGKSLAELVRVIQEGYNYGNKTFRWSNYSLTADNLKKLVESLGEENVTLNWQRINLSKINLSPISGRTLAHLFKASPELEFIDMSDCSLSGRIVNEMMKECCRMNVVLKDNMFSLKGNDLSDIDGKSLAALIHLKLFRKYWRWSDYSLKANSLKMLVEYVGENIILNWQRINLSKINLSPISGRTLAHLFKASPELEFIDMSDCSLSGSIVNEMMEECCRMNVVLKDNMLSLKGNDLSDIDGKLLAALINLNTMFGEFTKWSDYSLKANSLKMLVEYVGENITLTWEMIDLSGINLSLISGIILACLFKVSPDLKYIEMRDCSLSGRIVNKMMEECCRMNVVLKDKMLILKGNDLSDIDGKSLAELVRVFQEVLYNYGNNTFRWSNYSLTADNLKKLVESLGEENITLNWQRINLSKINLSPISGRTLAHLFKASPELEFIDMSDCSLSGRIVNEMMKECCRMNVVLKDNMFSLEGNDLSDIDGKSLAALTHLKLFKKYYWRWSDYSLTVDNLQKLVESSENITLIWKVIDLSGINLSSMSGITLAHLFKVSPKLKHINMSDCSLSGRIVNEMMEECCRLNVVLKDIMLNLKGNDLSDIDGKSLAKLLSVICYSCNPNMLWWCTTSEDNFKWSDYSLTADNIEMLVESVGDNITLIWEVIDLSKINLSSISGITLAHLLKVSPKLKHINMSDCSLSGRIVNEVMEECCRLNVVLKDIMLNLKGNDLSDIDGKSLAKLLSVICYSCNPNMLWWCTTSEDNFKWSDYSLTADNIEMLVESLCSHDRSYPMQVNENPSEGHIKFYRVSSRWISV